MDEKYIDKITGLPNKLALQESIKNSAFPKLIIIDIDAFEALNKRYGKEKADNILREFSKFLLDFIKESDLELFRVENDEFALLQDSPFDLEEFEELIFSLTKAIKEKKYFIQDLDIDFNIGATIGMSFDRPNIVNNSYMALKYSKLTGRDFTAYSEFIKNEIQKKESEDG